MRAWGETGSKLNRDHSGGHNPQSHLDLNQGQGWKHLRNKHMISAHAQMHTVNVNISFRLHVENRLPFIIGIAALVLKYNGLLFKFLK